MIQKHRTIRASDEKQARMDGKKVNTVPITEKQARMGEKKSECCSNHVVVDKRTKFSEPKYSKLRYYSVNILS
jgi:hypothetical protein